MLAELCGFCTVLLTLPGLGTARDAQPMGPQRTFQQPLRGSGDHCCRAWLSGTKLLRVVGLFCKQGELLRLCTQLAALSADGDGLG